MLARDIMTKDVCTVAPETRVDEVARRLAARRISAVPVVDPENRVVGMISESDLLRRPETGTTEHRSWWSELFLSPDTMAREYVKTHALKAGEIMTRHVFCVAESSTLPEIVDALEAHRIKRVPVVRDGRLVGIVSRSDLVRALADVAKQGAPPSRQPDDRSIREELDKRMKQQPWARSVYVQTMVHDGVVEFWGLADSEEHRHGLRVLAERIPGVTRVEDRMKTGIVQYV